jgi:hypothetical protein
VSEHWIWSNGQKAWMGRDRARMPYATTLREAGRFAEGIAAKIVKFGNQDQTDQDWPDLVMIPVTNDYLFPEGKRLVEEFVVTGDRQPLDDAFLKAEDTAVFTDPLFQESFGQMLRGEGQVIRSSESGART